jgi:hypothetical protein
MQSPFSFPILSLPSEILGQCSLRYQNLRFLRARPGGDWREASSQAGCAAHGPEAWFARARGRLQACMAWADSVSENWGKLGMIRWEQPDLKDAAVGFVAS